MNIQLKQGGNMYKEVMQWLHLQHMPVAESHLRLRLESHPDYPSLIAVQDTLEELGINSYACQGTKEELKKENKPFLAHFTIGEGNLLFFKDLVTAEQKVKDFDKYWSGNVMFAEPAKKYGNAEHDKLYKKEKQNKAFGIASIILLAGAFFSLSIGTGSTPVILLTTSNFVGLYFSWLIAQKEFGISNSISDKICSMAKHSRCESVLFSKGAKLFNWLTWGDVGIVYFITSLLYLQINQLTNQPINLELYYILSLAGIVFPLYSIYYQWKVIKQWCMLCIGVLVVLGINAVISLTQITRTALSLINFTETGKGVLILFVISLTILSAWQLIKTLYQKSLSTLSNEIKATRLKRKPEIFNALLQQQPFIQKNLPEPDEAIKFGNPTAPYQIVLACNPYCSPCAKAHHYIEALYEKHPGKLTVCIRFALDTTDTSDKRTEAANEILKVALHKPFEAIRDWYNVMDLEKYKQLHHTKVCLPEKQGEAVNEEIAKHIHWAKQAEVTATPTVFVNGKKLPELYNWTELVAAIDYELK